MFIRRDARNTVIEIIARKDDDKGKPIYHADVYREIFAVPHAEVGWIFDEFAGTCRPPQPVPPDPETARLERMSAIEIGYLRAMLIGNRELALQLETEYKAIVSPALPDATR